MPTHKLNWINSIVQTMHKTIWDRIFPEKQQQQNVFSVLLKLVEKNLKKIQAYRGCKFAVTVKISAHLELQNRNEKSSRAQTCAGMKSPYAK